MKGLVGSAVAVLAVLMVLFMGWLYVDSVSLHVQCDGALPVWMLNAQDYNGGGCAEVLPSHEAPPDADWTLYCMGLCDRFEPWPPPS
jgi:hypothetical protein